MPGRRRSTSEVFWRVSDSNGEHQPVPSTDAGGDSDRATFKIMAESDAVVPIGTKGEIVKTALVGNSLETKTIGGTKRNHVPEGARDLQVEVTVEWTVEELLAIYGSSDKADPAEVTVMITTDSGSTGEDWISWIDERQDVNFPDNRGLLEHTVEIKLPKKPKTTDRESDTLESTGKLDVDILHDDREAENDMFYIEVRTSSDIDVTAGRSGDKRTLDTVIEDDDPQSVTVKKGTSSGPSTVYESAGEIEFTVAADPPRNQLSLEVDLDMLDLEGTTVRAAKISVDTRRLELNADGDGSGNSATVTVHLPASDGDRMDDEYQLQATVNPYSLASGTDTTVEATSHRITVLDVHKLPTLMVSPATATLKEGADEKTELTLTINRNPANTTVSSTEKLQYTQEEVTVMLAMGAGSTADASDYSIMPASVTFPKRERGAYTASMTVEVEALPDLELDDMEMLVLDAEVAGGVAANGTDKDMHMGVSMLTIEEGTDKLVWAKTTDEIYAAVIAAIGEDKSLNTKETAEIMGSALFNVEEGVSVRYTAESDNMDAVSVPVSSGAVMLQAGDMAGDAEITVTAHASMPSGVTILDQTDPTEASVTFPVTVEDMPLEPLEITLSTDPMDGMVEEGGMVTVMAAANRMDAANIEVMLMRDAASTASDDDFSFDAPQMGVITIMAGETMGQLTLTATDDYDVEGMEMLTLVGMMGDMMVGSVTIEIADNDMETTYTLSRPEDMNIAEGMSAMLTVAASQMVRMDTEVMIMRDGASSATDADFTAESVMIMEGETTGTTMVMAVEDDMAEEMEMLTLYGMVDDMATNSVDFYLWDAAVPALPLIAQLLLAALLGLGGYRRYLRRR